MQTLKKGDRGEEVKRLQNLLGVKPVDGIFGIATDRQVKQFQSSKGLTADGIVGKKTWDALGAKKAQTTRKITHIFVHCTAGSQSWTPQQLLDFFYKTKKWSRPGYHYVVDANGGVTNIWPEEKYSNGVSGMNANSINVAWIGGVDKDHPNGIDNRTNAQKLGLRHILRELRNKYPSAVIMGHRDTSPDLNNNGVIDPWERIKECPCFDAMVEYKDI